MNMSQPQSGILSGPYSLRGFPLLPSLNPLTNWISLMSVHRAKNLPWSSALGFYFHFKPFFAYFIVSKGKWPQSSSRERSEAQTALQNSPCDEFHTILGGNAPTGAHSSDFPVSLRIALPWPWHQAGRKPPLMEFANRLSSEIHTSTGLPQHCCQK